ncbi:MAG: hypothetical protein HY332_24675 [Chloroflexi bacterium]|nr:hypothetical protein [Chloroflexota bacterium]
MLIALLPVAGTAFADSPVGLGQLWLDGKQVRTLLPPAAMPHQGVDPLFKVPGQAAVAGVGPGDGGFHGGHWQVYDVSWNVTPYLLTSATAVAQAAAAGDITITRNAAADFLCPIQP